jgi:hypothetical protein
MGLPIGDPFTWFGRTEKVVEWAEKEGVGPSMVFTLFFLFFFISNFNLNSNVVVKFMLK